jgi:hypothetical protein
MESADRNSFMSVSKLWSSLHRFSQKLPSHNTFLWTSPVLNFKKSDEKCRKRANIKRNMPFTELTVTELKLDKQLFVKNSYIKLLEHSMQISWGLILRHGEMYLVSKYGISFMSYRVTKQ